MSIIHFPEHPTKEQVADQLRTEVQRLTFAVIDVPRECGVQNKRVRDSALDNLRAVADILDESARGPLTFGDLEPGDRFKVRGLKGAVPCLKTDEANRYVIEETGTICGIVPETHVERLDDCA